MIKPKGEKLLNEIKEIVRQCDRCGTCLPVCPLFGVKDIEKVSARGKNNIARALVEGGIEADGQVSDTVNMCLLCGTCVSNCPNKVKTDEVMMNMRQYFADKKGGPGFKYKIIGKILKDRTAIKMSAGSLGLIKKVKLNRFVPYGMAPHKVTRDDYLKHFGGPAALKGSALTRETTLDKDTKIAYFRGCGMEMLFPEAAADTIRILNTLTKVQLIDNVCCGLPHISHGLQNDFFELAKKNIQLFENADVVVSDCASCSSTLKHIAAYFADDPKWREAAENFSKKIMSLSEFLVKVGYKPEHHLDVKITFHEPCHLGRGQGVKKQPRELLKSAGNYIEMNEADVCCGGSGTFHTDYPEIANAVLDKKRLNIEASQAQIVVTECPICLIQLNKAAQKGGNKFQAMHISQVI